MWKSDGKAGGYCVSKSGYLGSAERLRDSALYKKNCTVYDYETLVMTEGEMTGTGDSFLFCFFQLKNYIFIKLTLPR